ncbi:MAG: hypothetical protein LV479_07125 [Methylacidiphilales bacterium]|nr:hypothetical protein [Candidatus Methylacidiphilales bacterium]
MKTRDTWATWEAELKIQRQRIIEQAGCPMIRFTVDSSVYLLPYSRLLHVQSRVQENHYQIRAIWPGLIVTVEGYYLDSLMQLLAEHRLQSATLRSGIEEERQENRPYLERISFSDMEALTTCVNLR